MTRYKEMTLNYDGKEYHFYAETVGRQYGGYLNYYRCAVCKNQSVGEDFPRYFYCNNNEFLQDDEDKRQYCANYERDFDYIRKNNIVVK